MTTRVGRFEIVRELGRGAQSVVYLAHDPQLEREIAIKTLHFDRPDASQNQVLLSEARMVSKLRHPNIVPIFEAGEEGGDLYLVFEYVPGKNLAQVLKEQGALPPMRAATIMRQVLDAVAGAHHEGIVHRDLKPSNILLDDNGLVRVMDFGIAAKVSAPADGQAAFTGTPAYMAPEYIERREITERTDIFAAGLILYELLLAKRAIAGKDMYQIMYALAHQDIQVPRGGVTAIDDRLADVLYKALARAPENRYASAEQFREALEAYLDPTGEALPASADAKQSTLEFLLRRMRLKGDFPAFSESVATINRIASSENDSVSKLSNSILRDFALTNKLLKLVNSAFFRHSGGGNISTVSRAVLVLGFNAVRNLALTVLLYEHMQRSPSVAQLIEEFVKANMSGLLARDFGRKAGVHDGEQLFICALFHNLGRLLSQYYFPEETETIRRLMGQRSISEDAAALQVLGVSLEDLGCGVAKSWGLPPVILDSMRRLPEGPLNKPASLDERLHHFAGLANELCGAMTSVPPHERAKALQKLSARYAEGIRFDEGELQASIERSFAEVGQLANIVHVNLQQTTVGRQIKAWSEKAVDLSPAGAASPAAEQVDRTVLGETVVAAAVPGESQDVPGGAIITVDAQAILTAGIQDISNTLVEEFKLNDVLRIILETMYRALGFQRVILSIRDAKTSMMQGRLGFGPDANEVLKVFRFSLKSPPDVFMAALTKGVDVLISDVNEAHIRARIPAWYRQSVAAETFVLLPLMIKGNPVALIYADRQHANEIVVSEKELLLLRTLRNQAILAIKQTT